MSDPSKEAERLTREMARAAQEMARAAQDMSEAVAEALRAQRDYEAALRVLRAARVDLKDVERALELIRVAREALPEEEAVRIANEAVHEVRENLWAGIGPDAGTPEQADVERWVLLREERRRREGYESS